MSIEEKCPYNWIFTWFQSVSLQDIINCKVKNSNFTEEKPGTRHLNITDNKTSGTSHLMHWEGQCHFCGTLTQMCQTNHKNTLDKPKQGTVYKNNWLLFPKVSRSWKTKKRLRKCYRLEETKEIWQLNVMWDPGTEERTLMENCNKVQIRSIDWLIILFHGLDNCTTTVWDVNIRRSEVKGIKDYFCNFFGKSKIMSKLKCLKKILI